jgi:hypothetical protein
MSEGAGSSPVTRSGLFFHCRTSALLDGMGTVVRLGTVVGLGTVVDRSVGWYSSWAAKGDSGGAANVSDRDGGAHGTSAWGKVL